MSIRHRRMLFAACFGLQLVVFGALTAAARRGAQPSAIALGSMLAFAPYLGAVAWSSSLPRTTRAAHPALWASLALGSILIFAPSVLSDDLFRYLWEGRLWLEGVNPYRVAPDDPSLSYLRDDLWTGINNKSLTSIYPPLAQLLFVASAVFGGHLYTVKLLALFLHGLGVTAVARICEDPRAPWALGLNPLLLSESALGGHFDIAVGIALLVAAWLLTQRRFFQAGVATCAAVGLKLVGWLMVPLFWRRPKAMLATILASLLVLAPMIVARSLVDPGSGPGQFASRWRGNESLFAVFDWGSHRVLSDPAAGIAARIAIASVLLLLTLVAVRRQVPALQACRALLWAALLLSPQVHPWYLAWLLPVEIAAGGRAGLVWSAVVLAAYAPLDRWLAEGVWVMPWPIQIAEYAAVFAALALDPRRPALTRRDRIDDSSMISKA